MYTNKIKVKLKAQPGKFLPTEKFSGSLVNVLNARERIFRVLQRKVKLYKYQLTHHTAIKRVPRHLRRLSIKLPQAESGTSLEAQ